MPISKITEASTDSGLYYAKAWVNFNGTGTVAIRASGNVTSITDNGTGDYTVNFTTALPDANYEVNVTAGGIAGVPCTKCPPTGVSLSTFSAQLQTLNVASTPANFDYPYVFVSIFR